MATPRLRRRDPAPEHFQTGERQDHYASMQRVLHNVDNNSHLLAKHRKKHGDILEETADASNPNFKRVIPMDYLSTKSRVVDKPDVTQAQLDRPYGT